MKKGMEAAVEKKAKEVAALLKEAGLRCKADFSQNTPGFKYNEWEMKGVPFRIEIGGREAESGILTVARRDNKSKAQVKEGELVAYLRAEGKKMLEEMKTKAQASLDAHVSKADGMEALFTELEKGNIVSVPFCTMEKAGEKCADAIKEKCSANVRGARFDKDEKAHGKCIACGKAATAVAYVARQY